MISLAAGGTELVFFLIMAAFGFISWVFGKIKSAEKPPDPMAPHDRQVGRPIPAQPSEDERMRKFLEALGIPADAAPSPRPAPRPAPALPAAPRSVVQRPRRTLPAPPPLPPRRAIESLDEAEALTQSAATIEAGHLITHEVVEFDTVSSHVSAIPLGQERSDPIAETVSAPPASALSRSLHAALRSPTELRTALLLREILGPPRGLQT